MTSVAWRNPPSRRVKQPRRSPILVAYRAIPTVPPNGTSTIGVLNAHCGGASFEEACFGPIPDLLSVVIGEECELVDEGDLAVAS